MLKGPNEIFPFNFTILIFLDISIFFSLNFSSIRIAVNGVAYISQFNKGHMCATAPI